MGNSVWDVAKIATNLKLANASLLAWPMLLSQRKGPNLLTLLKADDPKLAAFKPIASTTPGNTAFRTKYCCLPTEAEKAKLPPAPAGASGGSRGGRGGAADAARGAEATKATGALAGRFFASWRE